MRDFDEDIKIIIHITAKNSDRFSYVKNSGADYDIIGLSYYSWENHGTIDELVTKIGNLESTYSKKVMVVETSFAALDYGDSDDMTQAATNLSAKNYSDVTIESNAVVPSEDVQKAILRHTMQEVYGAGGIGICIWGGERRDYQYGLFDWDGNTYKAIDAFNYKPSDGYPAEDASDAGGSEENEKTMTLTLSFPENSSAASVSVKYWAADSSGSSFDTKTATVSSNSASVTLSNSYSSDWGFNGTVKIYDSSSKDITSNFTLNDSDYGTCSKFWFKFSEGGTQEFSFTKTGSSSDNTGESTETEKTKVFTGTFSSGNPVSIVNSDDISKLTITKIKISISDYTASENPWITAYAGEGDWPSGNSVQWTGISDGSSISSGTEWNNAFIGNVKLYGLKIAGDSGLSATVTVTYTE